MQHLLLSRRIQLSKSTKSSKSQNSSTSDDNSLSRKENLKALKIQIIKQIFSARFFTQHWTTSPNVGVPPTSQFPLEPLLRTHRGTVCATFKKM